jgi:hypothetical protein
MHDIPELDGKGLRKFGVTTAAIAVVLFGLLLPWLRDRPLPWWPWVLATMLSLWALVAPGSLSLIYRPWMKVGLVLGWINTRLILGVVFWLLILPLGLLLRVIREKKVDRLTKGFDPAAKSYWSPCPKTYHTNMEKPF